MNTRLLLPFIAFSTLAISACTPDPEQVALEQYLGEAEVLGEQMSEMGTKFETLMNVQGDVLAWSDAEEQELDTVHSAFLQMETDAKEMTTPVILEDIHPLLIESIQEMRMAVEGVLKIAQNPALASNKLANEIEAHGVKGEELGTQYAEEMEAAIAAAYPEMMEE
jgi:hypothetical protein